MSAVPVQQMADRVAQLMEDRLHIRGKDLQAKLRYARGRMPRRVQAEAAVLAKAAETALNPKLMMRLDHDRIASAYDTCVRYLGNVGGWDRRRAAAMNIGGSIAFQLLVVAGLLFAVLTWRGYL
jgi:hypothetical protein